MYLSQNVKGRFEVHKKYGYALLITNNYTEVSAVSYSASLFSALLYNQSHDNPLSSETLPPIS